MNRRIVYAVLVVIASLFALAAESVIWRAYGAPPPGLVIDPQIGAWFRSLTNPSNGLYCCDWTDGHILADGDWRDYGPGYQVRIDGEWVTVPRESVLLGTSNPTGSAVAFWPPGQRGPVFCFVLPAMS